MADNRVWRAAWQTCRPQGSRQVRSLLRPVDAGASERPPLGSKRGRVHSQIAQQAVAASGDFVTAGTRSAQGPLPKEVVEERHAELSAKVVVARPRLAQRGGDQALPERLHGDGRGDDGQCLEPLCRHRVVAVCLQRGRE